MTCTFFGHSDAPENICKTIEEAIVTLIECNSVNKFYVGNHGNFDNMVIKILNKLKKSNYDINFYIVLAYLPQKSSMNANNLEKTIYPDGLEKVPKRYAILERNKWMLLKSDYVISYVRHIGNAKNFKQLAEKRGKTIIEL